MSAFTNICPSPTIGACCTNSCPTAMGPPAFGLCAHVFQASNVHNQSAPQQACGLSCIIFAATAVPTASQGIDSIPAGTARTPIHTRHISGISVNRPSARHSSLCYQIQRTELFFLLSQRGAGTTRTSRTHGTRATAAAPRCRCWCTGEAHQLLLPAARFSQWCRRRHSGDRRGAMLPLLMHRCGAA